MLRDELARATARADAAERAITAARVVTERLSYVTSDALDELRDRIAAHSDCERQNGSEGDSK